MKTPWTLRKKLLASFLSVATLTLLLGMVGYYAALTGDRNVEQLGLVRLPAIESLQNLFIAQKHIDAREEEILSPQTAPEARAEAHRAFDEMKQEAAAQSKIYEALPRTPAEEKAWQAVRTSWDVWWKTHEDYVAAEQAFVAFDVLNPAAWQRDLMSFRAAHFELQMKVLDHIDGTEELSGGDDATACSYGRWLEAYQTKNDGLRKFFESTQPTHHQTHELVAQAKALAAQGDREAARKMVHGPLEESVDKTLALLDEAVRLVERGNTLLATMGQKMERVDATGELAEEALTSLVKLNAQAVRDTATAAEARANLLKALSLWATILGVGLGLALGWIISRRISHVLSRISASLKAGANQTTSAAAQVSAASQSLAEGASEQAASLEETSSSLEEMASMTRRNAETAGRVKDLGSQALQAGDSGVRNMSDMNVAMNAIQASSGEVGKIIKTIDEIAFQTNILALNAAVEAARAGEAGMGFAVVADEVRNLAQRAARAAKETASKIEDSIEKCARGASICGQVSRSLEEIVGKARQVDELAGEVAAASQEQSQGIDQVNTAVTQMDKVTQSNAASAEESASAAEELNSQAESMREIVGELLRLVGGDAPAPDRTHPGTPPTHRAQPRVPAMHSALAAPTGNGSARATRVATGRGASNGSAARPQPAVATHGAFQDF